MLVDTSYAARGASGTAVYTERLVAALRAEGGVQVIEARQRRRLRPGARGGPLGPLRSVANVLLDTLWLHAGLARAARLVRADVVHHPLPAHSRCIVAPQVSTFHDLAFLRLPDRYQPAWRLFAARAYRRAARRCAALVCPTEATGGDLVAMLGADRERVVVAPHGPGQAEGADPGGATEGGPLLFVGDTEPRKNLSGLLCAYAAYRTRADEPVELVLTGTAAAAAGEPGVHGRPTAGSDELLALYRRARALVHPALHEGFGLTPLEAMALGVPVLAVRNPGTEEVCGEAALLVEPGGLDEGLRRIASDAVLRADLAARGRERAALFSWAEAARRHRHAYNVAVGRHAAAPDS